MANLRAVLQDQVPWRLVDEDPDQHSHPLFRMSPGKKMLGARGREGIKRYRRRNERFPRNEILYFHEIIHHFKKWRHTQTHQPSQPMEWRRMAGDRRGSQVQEPGTKTEAVICPGEQDWATQDQHRHHRPGRRERGTKEPKSRSSSLARVSASTRATGPRGTKPTVSWPRASTPVPRHPEPEGDWDRQSHLHATTCGK